MNRYRLESTNIAIASVGGPASPGRKKLTLYARFRWLTEALDSHLRVP